MNKQEKVFNHYVDYRSLTKSLPKDQKKKIWQNLSDSEKKDITSSYVEGGWKDLSTKNQLENLNLKFKQELGIDLIDLRVKAFKGKSIYVDSEKWNIILKDLKDFSKEDKYFLIGGLKYKKETEKATLVVKS